HGLHWARQTIVYSASTGFFTFFLFLGFSYFDPFHAFVTAVLLQFLLFAVDARLPSAVVTVAPNLRADWCCRRSPASWRWNCCAVRPRKRSRACPESQELAQRLGLFVEEFSSPYKPEGAE